LGSSDGNGEENGKTASSGEHPKESKDAIPAQNANLAFRKMKFKIEMLAAILTPSFRGFGRFGTNLEPGKDLFAKISVRL
jgi:hypothetical protein